MSRKAHYPYSLAKKKPCIVIDPGHGGDDIGAIGYNKIEEKMVVFSISKLVKKTLKSKGYHILLTRKKDCFVPLTKRTELANKVGAHLFVSIHANAALNKNAFGVETFYYPHGYGEMQKNEHTNYLQSYLAKKTYYSLSLAEKIQRFLCSELSFAHSIGHAIDRKVKKAPFQVLIGSTPPSVLVEVGFLTHAYEGKLLSTMEYQKKIAKGIVKGIMSYIHDTTIT